MCNYRAVGLFHVHGGAVFIRKEAVRDCVLVFLQYYPVLVAYLARNTRVHQLDPPCDGCCEDNAHAALVHFVAHVVDVQHIPMCCRIPVCCAIMPLDKLLDQPIQLAQQGL